MAKFSLSCTLLAVGLAAPTLLHAQDAASFWTGTYVGVSVGQGQLSSSQYSPAQRSYGGYHAADYGGGHAYGSVQAGVRRQLGSMVMGVRLRHQVTGSDGDSFLKVDEILSSNAVSVTTLSATLGYLPQPQVLVYATAGAAHGRFNYASIDERWSQVDDSLNASRSGIALGMGVEYQLTNCVSFFTEVSQTKFSKSNSTFDYGPEASMKAWTYEFTHRLSELQLGMNIRF